MFTTIITMIMIMIMITMIMITMLRQVLTIAEIVLHPSYTFAGSSHDIALLKVIACSYWQFDQYSFLLCLTLQVDINIPIVISLLFNTKLDFSKISETVNLNDWAPACLPTSVITIIFTNIKMCNLIPTWKLWKHRSVVYEKMRKLSFQGADFTGQNGWVYGEKYIF